MRILNKTILIGLLWALICTASHAEYMFSRALPIDYKQDELTRNQYISHNYGEYRSSTYLHDGMDLRILNLPTHSMIYPIATGTAYIYPDLTRSVAKSNIPATELSAVASLFIDFTQQTLVFNPNTTAASVESCLISNGTKTILRQGLAGRKEGWGNCVIVDHSTYQTRYAHLSKIYVKERDPVFTSTVLGLSGNTGLSFGEHLHFGIGNNGLTKNNLAPNNTENPILAGLVQPEYGTLKISPDPKDPEGHEIRLLSAGIDGTFGGDNDVIYSDSNDVINIPKPGALLKAVVSAYHMIGNKNGTRSVPYKIEFEVEKIKGANDFPTLTKSIIFDSRANMNARGEIFCFSRPYTTTASTEDYYGVKFTPTAGE
jgi:hypothetical protein